MNCLSTDIDIIVESGTDFEHYIEEDHKSGRKGEDTYNEILFKTWFLWDSERQIKLGASN
jgi:hypothetical protein